MKKILILLLASTVSFSLNSCEDAYEIEPIGVLDDEATFRSVGDAQTFLNGIYATLDNTSQIYFSAVFTDEARPGPSYNGTERDLHNFILNSTTGSAFSIWYNNHNTINRVNRLLNAVQYFEVEEGEEAQLNDILAQGRFLRALAHLNLISFYSADMADPNSLGGLYFTHVPLSNESIARGTNAEIYQLMEDDLNFAFSNLSSTNSFIYPTRAAAEALMARMYAYREMYPQARQHAQNVISNYGISLTVSQPFNLSAFYNANANTNPYRGIWNDMPVGMAEQRENVFSLQSLVAGTDVGFAPAGLFYANATRLNGSPLWAMGVNQYGVLSEFDNDVRMHAFVDPTSDFTTNDIMIDKYPGIAGSPLRNNLKLIRLSEMYFILAEAEVAAGNYPGAAGYIHQIRVARSTDGTAVMPSYSGATAAWAGILNERRKELCFEGHRYVDLRRLGALAGVSIDRNVLDNETSTQATTISIDDHRFTMPVPINEMNVNSAAVQNPGY